MALTEQPPIGAVVRRNFPGHDHPHLGVFHGREYVVEDYHPRHKTNFYLEGIDADRSESRSAWGLDYFDLVSLPSEKPIEPWWEKQEN